MQQEKLVLAVLMGIPASGKSTFCAKELAEYVRVNYDSLKTRYRERTLLEECLVAGKPVVIDNTNVTRKERAGYIEAGKNAGYRVEGFFFQSRVKECAERNTKRTGKDCVPNVAIAAKSKILELPAMEEGFDKLYFVKIAANGGFEISDYVI